MPGVFIVFNLENPTASPDSNDAIIKQLRLKGWSRLKTKTTWFVPMADATPRVYEDLVKELEMLGQSVGAGGIKVCGVPTAYEPDSKDLWGD